MAQDSNMKKQPPNSQEAEEALLGAILLNNRVLTDVVEIIKSDDFYWSQNKTIYEHAVDMWEKGNPVDVLTLQEALKSAKLLDRIGGPLYINQLFDRVPASQNAPHYATIVHEMSLRRKIADMGRELVSFAFDSSDTSENILDSVGQKFTDLAQREIKRKVRSMSELVTKLHTDLAERRVNKGLSGLKTDYKPLDDMLGGFQKSDFIILAARPSIGKTALALNIAQNVAEMGKRVVFFSLEMSAEQLALRLLTSMSGVNSQLIRKGEISKTDWDLLIEPNLDKMDRLPILINDNPTITPLGIRAESRRVNSEYEGGIDLIIVDYLQLINPSERTQYENRVVEVSVISRSMKSLARELEVPLLALSQLSRKSEELQRQPKLSDLRESGSLEQDADVVMFLHHPKRKKKKNEKEKLNIYSTNVGPDKDVDESDESEESEESLVPGTILTKLIVEKHRNGPTGAINLLFIKENTRFALPTETREAEFADDEGEDYDTPGEEAAKPDWKSGEYYDERDEI